MARLAGAGAGGAGPLGQAAREGRYAVIINDVTDRDCLAPIRSALERHGAEDVVYSGEWQTEDLSIRRGLG